MTSAAQASSSRAALIWAALGSLPPEDWAAAVCRRMELIVVLDGLKQDAAPLKALGVRVLVHPVALGRGRCVKTALNDYLLRHPAGPGVLVLNSENPVPMVWLDKMEEALTQHPFSLSLSYTPVGRLKGRQWMDRRLSAILFSVINGAKISDVRPPVRAMPIALCPHCATAPGEGDEYYLKLLLNAKNQGVPLNTVELPPAAYPLPPIRARQWFSMALQLLGFLAASLLSAGVDYAVFTLLWMNVTKVVTFCTVGARVVSSILNYALNRKLVFKDNSTSLAPLARYYALVAVLLVGNIFLIKLFKEQLGIPVLFSKLMADVGVYCVSYILQRDIVFRRSPEKKA